MAKVIADKTAEDRWYVSMDENEDENGAWYDYYEGFIQNDFIGKRIEVDDEDDAEYLCKLLNDQRAEVRRLQRELAAKTDRVTNADKKVFKVGDRVKLITEARAYIKYKGQVGDVFKVATDSVYAYEVRFEDGAEHIFKASELMYADYRAARGAFDWQEGDEPAEVSVRRLRDGDHFTSLGEMVDPLEGFMFTLPEKSQPVKFFDDEARQALNELE